VRNSLRFIALFAPLITAFAAAICHADDEPAPHSDAGRSLATAPATSPAADVRKISIDEFDRMRKEPGVVVLDVRTPREFAEGHVAGAVNLSVAREGSEHFDDEVAKLDRDKIYLLYCARGNRSAIAVDLMSKMGFTHLNDFSGGMQQWMKEGKPVEK
jgi:rhodanese-related sulfurtransferase